MTALIVGAGISGLTAARTLQAAGWSVTVVDKGRGPGGRLATRRMGPLRFDHGAQYFSALSPRFRQAVDEWLAQGVVQHWFEVNGDPRYRGSHGMTAVARHLAAGLDVRLSTRIAGLTHDKGLWQAAIEDGGTLTANALILTPPVPQSLELLGRLTAHLPHSLQSVAYSPCFAMLVSTDKPSALPAPGYARPDSGALSWIADNTAKGISRGTSAVSLHATPEFTLLHYDSPHEALAPILIESARPYIGSAAVLDWQIHRWRYSRVTQLGPEPCFFTTEPGPLALAGDAFGPPRIEGAYLSGLAAAIALTGSL
jgi:renalase